MHWFIYQVCICLAKYAFFTFEQRYSLETDVYKSLKHTNTIAY